MEKKRILRTFLGVKMEFSPADAKNQKIMVIENARFRSPGPELMALAKNRRRTLLRSQDPKPLKIAPDVAAVSGDKPIRLTLGVGGDQKIGNEMLSGTASLSVSRKRFSGQKRGFQGEGSKDDAEIAHSLAQNLEAGEKRGHFSPNNLRCDERGGRRKFHQ